MNTVDQFLWVDFYQEFAKKLVDYKDNRAGLIKKVKEIYNLTGFPMPTLEKENNLVDIDPFTVFGLFNKKLTNTNRIKILEIVAKLFDLKSKVPTSFDALPVLINKNATYYRFIDERNVRDIDDLWSLFISALEYDKDPSSENKEKFSHYFDIVNNQKGNGNSKITMGLYWIAPNSFLNLDGRNQWYIFESGQFPSKILNGIEGLDSKISAADYFKLIEKVNIYLQSPESIWNNFKELSFEAWRYSEIVNREIKESKMIAESSAMVDDEKATIHYWVYAPGRDSYMWEEFYKLGIIGIGWDAMGDLRLYQSRNEMIDKMRSINNNNNAYTNDSLATWQFVHDVKIGDVILVKKGLTKLVGRGVVTSEYIYNMEANNFRHQYHVKWTHKGEWPYPGKAPMKTLTNITNKSDLIEKLNNILDDKTMADLNYQVESKGKKPEDVAREYLQEKGLLEVKQ